MSNSNKRPLSSSTGGGHGRGTNTTSNNDKKSTPTAGTVSNNASSGSASHRRGGNNEDMNKWWRSRQMWAYEGKRGHGGVKLNFNYWATKGYVTSSEVHHLIDHFMIGKGVSSPTTLSSMSSSSTSEDGLSFVDLLDSDEENDEIGLHSEAIKRIVVLNIHGLDPIAMEKHYSETSFFHKSTSVPLLCVQFPDIQKRADNTNPNPWFYNDVKTISSLLLWSKMNPTPVLTLFHLPISKLFHEFRLIFEVQHAGGSTMLITQSDKNNYFAQEINVLLTTLLDALHPSKQKTKANIEELLQQNKDEDSIFGKFYRAHSTDGGMFSLMKIAPNMLRMVLIWDKDGSIDILDSLTTLEAQEEEGKTKLFATEAQLTFRTSITTFINSEEAKCSEEDKFQLSLKYVYERPGEMVLSTTLPASVALEAEEADVAVEAVVSTNSTTSNEIDIKEVLQRVYSQFTALSKQSVEQLVLSQDVLQLMGFMGESEFSGCLDTSDLKQWSRLYLSEELLLEEKESSKPNSSSFASKNRFANLDLEDGEEVDSDEEELSSHSNTKNMSAKAFQRIYQQATHFFLQNNVITDMLQRVSLPLDMVALDCEMCSTKLGLELTRISMLHPLHGVILDCLVKPNLDIVDYHTEFSGVDEALLEKITVRLSDIQELLRCLIGADTIIIGHSLDTDFKALQLIHHRVVDTSALFPHPSGLPYKHQLKKLVKDFLNQDIQEGTDGHSSIQDSVAALELMIYKIQQYSEHSHRFEEEMMQIGMNQVNNMKLINGNQAVKYSYFEYLEQNTSRGPIHVQVHSYPLLGSRPTWERDAIGYRDDSNVRTALKRFQSKVNTPQHVHTSESSASHWQTLLSNLTNQITEMNNRNGLIWGDVDLLLESDAFFGDVDEEETQPNKRMRRDESQMVESHSFRELSRKLDLLYASLPKHTLLLIPAQASLLPLRQMIAKKIRFKWEANSGTKKKPKVVLLGREKNNQRLQSEWDGNNDEIKLIDEAHRAAEGILFMRLKR